MWEDIHTILIEVEFLLLYRHLIPIPYSGSSVSTMHGLTLSLCSVRPSSWSQDLCVPTSGVFGLKEARSLEPLINLFTKSLYEIGYFSNVTLGCTLQVYILSMFSFLGSATRLRL